MSPTTLHRFAGRSTFRRGQTPRNIDQFTTCVNPAAGAGDAADLEMGFCVEILYGGAGIRTASNDLGSTSGSLFVFAGEGVGWRRRGNNCGVERLRQALLVDHNLCLDKD